MAASAFHNSKLKVYLTFTNKADSTISEYMEYKIKYYVYPF